MVNHKLSTAQINILIDVIAAKEYHGVLREKRTLESLQKKNLVRRVNKERIINNVRLSHFWEPTEDALLWLQENPHEQESRDRLEDEAWIAMENDLPR